MRGLTAAAVSLTALLTASGQGLAQTPASPVVDASAWPSANSPDAMTDAATLAFVEALLARMTVAEKVGQVIQADIGSITPADLAAYPLGSILAGGNSAPGGDERAPAQAWVDLARTFRAAAAARPGARVPLMFGIDAVHGHNNIVGATLFPHNIGLGATRNPDLIERIGQATALEVAATGADWTFGPTVAVPRDDRWGRTYEGYGEDPEIVAAYAGRMTLGLQGPSGPGRLEPGHIAGSAKHYLADGGTLHGRDQGDALISERDLIDIHASGYPPAIDAGVLTIMASFSSWNGAKHTANADLLTEVLRGPLGFDGFVVGDWNAHGQIDGCTNESCAAAFNAGIDMFMAPDSWKPLFDNTLAQVRSGEIAMTRLDEAVRRILTVKVKTGVFAADRPVEGRVEVLGSPEHRALAREAVRQSLVLLKNNGSVLPIRPGARVLVAGSADDIGQAAGGWTISWQGTGNTRADFPNGQSIWEGLEEAIEASGGTAELNAEGGYETRPDVAIVVFGEDPYAEFQGDLSDLDFRPRAPLALLRRLRAEGVPTVAVFLSGRPLYVNPEINASDAFVVAWLPGSEGGGLADVLVAGSDGRPRHDFRGSLSFSWPRSPDQAPQNRGADGYDPQFAYGFGLTYAAGVQTPALVEADEGSGASSMRFLADGRFVNPWSLVVRDSGGEARITDGARGVSPRAVVTVAPVDGQGQESARLITFTGPGQAIVTGPAIDLSGPDYAGASLTFRYRIDAGSASALSIGLANGVTSLAGGVGWQEASAPLSCFRSGEAPLTGVDRAWILTATAPATVAVEDIRLVATTSTACPSAAD
jgi:beta-glucosidase